MNKSNCLQYTINKPSSKQFLRQKIKDIDSKSKKYDSMSYDIDENHIHSIIPYKFKQRKVSKKEAKQSSPARINRSKSAKSKKNDTNIHTQNPSKNIGDLYYELMLVKSQYKNLKSSYSKLMQQKTQLTVRQQTQRAQVNLQLQKCKRQMQRYKSYTKQLQSQIDRLKRQCYKVMQLQKFKNKKLQEIIQEKDLMIAFLRNQLEKGKKNNQSVISTCANQSNLSFLQNTSPIYSFDYPFKTTSSIPVMNNVIIQQNPIKSKKNETISNQQDSLSFSREKSKQIDSFNSCLTNNECNTKIKPKKDVIIINSSDQKIQSITEECPTFQNREEQNRKMKKQVKKSQKMFNISDMNGQQKKISQSLQPPKDFKKQKTKISTKLLQITTDENCQALGNKSSVSLENKKSTIGSHRRKKINDKKKKC